MGRCLNIGFGVCVLRLKIDWVRGVIMSTFFLVHHCAFESDIPPARLSSPVFDIPKI